MFQTKPLLTNRQNSFAIPRVHCDVRPRGLPCGLPERPPLEHGGVRHVKGVHRGSLLADHAREDALQTANPEFKIIKTIFFAKIFCRERVVSPGMQQPDEVVGAAGHVEEDEDEGQGVHHLRISP